MLQVTFSDQSLGVLSSLAQVEQLSLMDKLGSFLVISLVKKANLSAGLFERERFFIE